MFCYFASDLHGDSGRYRKLFKKVASEVPEALFLGGDLLPPSPTLLSKDEPQGSFVTGFLAEELSSLKRALTASYPRVFVILGNDDLRIEEDSVKDLCDAGLLEYIHDARVMVGSNPVYGYANVPPSPFLLKDWERYDVSRYVDPGSVSPEEGRRSVPVETWEIRHYTIQEDLERLTGDDDLSDAVFLFHSPPYRTNLDRAALDGRLFDHVELDVNVGSIAIRRFIEERQPLLTLHGHIHESAGMTGSWRDRIGRTHMFTAAHDGPELALVRFDTAHLEEASRELC